jgi:nitroimidazol reductase NimA-like FMN-containing flavoprotein (pyridoxamine 5'-phosphate oxidase superfamily)
MTTTQAQAAPAAGDPQGAGLLSATGRTRHRRLRALGRTDRESLYAVLRAGMVAHLGVITGGWPMVVPTVYGFDADTLYLHGSVASQSMNTAGTTVCATITLTDGLVLARSVFEHTINYRSAMIYGQPRMVTDPAEKLAGLRLLTEHVAPGAWNYARQPNRKELAAVRLLALPLAEASVKIRTGPPDDGHSPDAALGLWAGELPLATTWQQPIPDPALPPGIPLPSHIGARAGTQADRYPAPGQGHLTAPRGLSTSPSRRVLDDFRFSGDALLTDIAAITPLLAARPSGAAGL